LSVKSAPKFVRAVKLDPAVLKELMTDVAANGAGKSSLVLPKRQRKDKVSATHVTRPKLPPKRTLTRAQQWEAHLWMIDTAQARGHRALRGLAVALARMIQADAFGVLFFDTRPGVTSRGNVDDLLWDRTCPVTKDGRTLRELLRPRRDNHQYDLATTALITNVWEPWRMARALECLGPDGEWGQWRQDPHNHFATVWHPWPLVWVSNGNHSTTAAALKGGGAIVCEESFDATPLLRVISTDGKHWFGEDGRVIGRVHSLPMAGIVEIGRRLALSTKGHRKYRR
jgi:hypothetical protein